MQKFNLYISDIYQKTLTFPSYFTDQEILDKISRKFFIVHCTTAIKTNNSIVVKDSNVQLIEISD